MKAVSVTDLRQNLPAYLARVQRGERIRVTSRGKAIAELTLPSVDAEPGRAARALLRGSVLGFDQALEPAAEPGDWDANK